MAFIQARQCDRCKCIEQDKPEDTDGSTGWAELKFTYNSQRWHICPRCVGDFAKFVANAAVLPAKTVRPGDYTTQ